MNELGHISIGEVDWAGTWSVKDRATGERLFGEILHELKAIATAKLSQENHSSLSTGDLINETIIRLMQLNQVEFQSRSHILALASQMMRRILIDQARRRNSDKREHLKVTLVPDALAWEKPIDVLELEDALGELRKIDPSRADIVEMRFFGGMSIEDVATVLDLSSRTVKRRWASSRAWLRAQLQG